MPFFRDLSYVFSSSVMRYSSRYHDWRFSSLSDAQKNFGQMKKGTMFEVEQSIGQIYDAYVSALNNHDLSPCRLECPLVFVERKHETQTSILGGSCPNVDLEKENGFVVPCLTVRVSGGWQNIINTAMHELDHSISFQIAQRFRDGQIDKKHPLYADCQKVFGAYLRNNRVSKRSSIFPILYATGLVERQARYFGRKGSSLCLR